MAEKLVRFLNEVDPKQLCRSLDQLDEVCNRIFKDKGASLDEMILNEIRKTNPYSFVWFCFLRANFLRGSDIISNKAFRQFVDYCNAKGNTFYFNSLGSPPFLPQFRKPKFQRASQIEMVLRQIRSNYGSGSRFVGAVKSNVDKHSDLPLIYLELMSLFTGFKQIGSKIANAIVNEFAWQLATLHRLGETRLLQSLTSEPWMKRLLLVSSCFNVMIDTHVKNFFEKKIGLKDVDHSALILLGRSVRSDLVEALFERYYGWIPEKEVLIERYKEFVGGNVLEKTIWTAYFVASNAKKEALADLLFFELSKDTFL